MELEKEYKDEVSIDSFVESIEDFDDLPLSNKVDYFIYFLTIVKGNEGTNNSEIKDCFLALKTKPYTNIPAYLKNNIKRGKSKTKFIFQNGLYHLERSYKKELEKTLPSQPTIKIIVPTDSYFPTSLFENTRGYLQKIATQAAKCYDLGLYDACAVMTRKLLEVLIIETFERHKISDNIKAANGHFYYLSDLIDKLLSEKTWNIGRNAKISIPSLKKMGDQSAHNRRYFVQETEINKLKDDLRTVLEELIHLIDYPTWK